jgi:uncharacterized protein with GYD domain
LDGTQEDGTPGDGASEALCYHVALRRFKMPKYLIQASYTADGLKGLLKDGGTKRRAAIEQASASVGGKLEAFYYAFGSDDVHMILDAPDNVSVAAVSLTAGAGGAATNIRTTVLLTPEEIDQAVQKTVSYTSAGQ